MSGTDGGRSSAEDDESRLRVVAALAAAVTAVWAIFSVSQIGGSSGFRVFYSAAVGFWSLVLCAFLVVRAFGRERKRVLWLLVAIIPLNLTFGRFYLPMLARSRKVGFFELSPPGFPTVVAVGVLLALATMGYFLERRHTPPVRWLPPFNT